MYGIARYFSPEARRLAASLDWTPTESGPRAHVAGDDRHDACPLGAALLADGCGTNVLPTAGDVGFLLASYGKISPLDRPDVRRKAVRFINDWDSGKIADLPRALGVKP